MSETRWKIVGESGLEAWLRDMFGLTTAEQLLFGSYDEDYVRLMAASVPEHFDPDVVEAKR